MALTVIGIFDNATDAKQAVEQLVSAGFSRSTIDLSAQTGENSMMGSESASGSTGYGTDETKDTGSSIGGFFSSLFGENDEDTHKYTRVADNGSVVTVHAKTDEEAEHAAKLLDEAGAVDVDERAATYDSLTKAPSASMGAAFGAVPATGKAADGDQTIKVIEENLEVGKRTVETGGVRLRSRIVARPVEESVRLREERVTVNRNPVNRPATAADLNAFKEGEISMTEHAEVPVVSKTANVVEEISVGKAVTEREETIRDTVRKTEVDVEQLGSTDKTARPSGDDEVTYSTK